MKRVHLIASIATLVLLQGSLSFAGDRATASLTINASVSARAKLTLSTKAINFPDADPDTTPSIPAAENAVSLTVKVRTGSSSRATLTHQAAGKLISGSNSIPVSHIKWTATGGGFYSGTMSSETARKVGTWLGPGTHTGTLSFELANSWDYATGAYTVPSTFTLTAP